MPQHHISRHELKEDEFVSGLDSAYGYYLEHQKTLTRLLIVIAIAVAIGAALFYWNRHRNQQASALLSAALETYHSPLQTPGQPSQGGAPAFATAPARATAAQAQFRAAADAYPGTLAGRYARYYIGLTQLELADSAHAETTLQSVAGTSDRNVANLARQALAQLYIGQEKIGQAQSLLRDLVANPSDTVPKAQSMLELAALERTSNPGDATRLYNQIKADYPDSQTAQQADRELAEVKK